jgi:hypothetical protein
MQKRLPVKVIDYLLYNYPYLRKEIDSLDSHKSGVIVVPSRGVRRNRSSVESLAIKKADFSVVLDVVDRAWKGLPVELRRIARAKYRRGMRHSEIEKRYFLSKSTLDRNLGCIRASVAGHLALINEVVLQRFWAQIGALWQR